MVISNTLSPFSIQNKKPATFGSTGGITTPSMTAKPTVPGVVSAPVQQTPATQPATSPAPSTSSPITSSAPVKGLLTPGTSSLAPVSTLQPPQPQTTFSGLVGGLAGASQPNTQAQKYTQQAADYGAGSIDVANKAQDIGKYYQNQIEGVLPLYRQAIPTGATTQVAEGNAMNAYNAASNRVSALQSAEQAALLGTAQGLTGQQQAANAANSAAGQSYTGQGQQITGLNAAAGLAQPQPYGLTMQPYNPLTDTYGGGGTGGILDRANLAGQVAGAQTAGAAAGNVQAGQTQQIADYKSAQQQGQNLASQVTDLINTFGLNPNDITAANAGIQYIANHTSDPRYQILSNYLTDIASRYAQVLTPAGGSQTDLTKNLALGMLNATASGKSIQDVLASLDQQATAVISGIPATGTVPGANQGSSSASSSGGSVSAGGYNFVFQNGKWVPQ